MYGPHIATSTIEPGTRRIRARREKCPASSDATAGDGSSSRKKTPAEQGPKEYRCNLGKRQIVTLTENSNGNTSTLRNFLKSNFKDHHRMFLAWDAKGTGKVHPTEEEIEIAAGKKDMTPKVARKYQNHVDNIQGSIVSALQKQAEAQLEPWDQDHFEALLAKWIAATDQPFTVVTQPEFIDLLNYVHRHSGRILRIPGSATMKRRVMALAKEVRANMKKMFAENESDFSISLDAWSSSNGHAFIALVAHWIDNDGKLQECLIEFAELLGDHSGASLATTVWKALEDYGLEKRIIAFVMDNATNNDTMVDAIAGMCSTRGIEFDATKSRMRCMPHTVHLAALKLLESVGVLSKEEVSNLDGQTKLAASAYQETVTHVDSPKAERRAEARLDLDEESGAQSALSNVSQAIAKLRRIVKHVRGSPQRRRLWEFTVKESIDKLDQALTESELMLILDVRTRWTSTHQMLRRALHNKDAIHRYVTSNPELSNATLSDADWTALHVVESW